MSCHTLSQGSAICQNKFSHLVRALLGEQHVPPSRDHYTPLDDSAVPTGEIAPVAGTPFDFTEEHPIRERFSEVPNGYDHSFVLFGMGRQARFIVKHGNASNTWVHKFLPMM